MTSFPQVLDNERAVVADDRRITESIHIKG